MRLSPAAADTEGAHRRDGRNLAAVSAQSWCIPQPLRSPEPAMLPVMRALASQHTEAASLPIHAAVAALAAGRHGVVSRAQLRGIGMSDTAITGAVARGQSHTVRRGVFCGRPSAGRGARPLGGRGAGAWARDAAQ